MMHKEDLMERAGSQRTILNINSITLFTEGLESGQYVNADFEIFGGQLALVRLNRLHEASAFADMFCGLRKPSKGSVLFLGRDWQLSPVDIANAMRGKIGRVFSSGQWLDGFSLAENILLSECHHTRRTRDTLLDEAAHLSESFRLPGLPMGYPEDYKKVDLQRAGCVRAFMGDPLLLLLEDPTDGMCQNMLSDLVNNIRRIRNLGAAVLWMTRSDDVWLDASIPVDRFFRIFGQELMEVKRKL